MDSCYCFVQFCHKIPQSDVRTMNFVSMTTIQRAATSVNVRPVGVEIPVVGFMLRNLSAIFFICENGAGYMFGSVFKETICDARNFVLDAINKVYHIVGYNMNLFIGWLK